MKIIIICWVVFLIVWIIGSYNTKRTNKGKGWQWWNIAPFTGVIIMYLLSKAEFFRVLGTRVWEPAFVLNIITDVIAVAGLIILFWARFELGRNWSAKVVLKENHELITIGPYAYVRHPIYTGLLLLVFASVLWLANLASFVVLIIVFISFWYKARSEERLLITYFGEKYITYKHRTKSLIPFIF